MDPYEDMPSPEEIKASGAADWIEESLGQQRTRDAKLKQQLRGETGSIRSEKDALKRMLELEPDHEPHDLAPDLFAEERAKARQERGKLPSLLDDLKASRKSDEDLLKGFFG